MTERPSVQRSGQFLVLADEIEQLAQLTTPTPAQVDRVMLLLSVPSNRRHFFQYASGSWLPILWDKEKFVMFEEPKPGDDGNYYASSWDAARYFIQFSGLQPEVTLDIIKSIETDNWLVIHDLAEALKSLPEDILIEAIPFVNRWMTSRFFSASMASFALIELLDQRVSKQEWKTALQLFEILTKWETGNGKS